MIEKLENLKILNLSHNRITGRGIGRALKVKIQGIDLSFNPLLSDCVIEILSAKSQLRRIEVQGCELDISAIAQALGSSDIETIGIDLERASEDSLNVLREQLMNFPGKLKTIISPNVQWENVSPDSLLGQIQSILNPRPLRLQLPRGAEEEKTINEAYNYLPHTNWMDSSRLCYSESSYALPDPSLVRKLEALVSGMDRLASDMKINTSELTKRIQVIENSIGEKRRIVNVDSWKSQLIELEEVASQQAQSCQAIEKEINTANKSIKTVDTEMGKVHSQINIEISSLKEQILSKSEISNLKCTNAKLKNEVQNLGNSTAELEREFKNIKKLSEQQLSQRQQLDSSNKKLENTFIKLEHRIENIESTEKTELEKAGKHIKHEINTRLMKLEQKLWSYTKSESDIHSLEHSIKKLENRLETYETSSVNNVTYRLNQLDSHNEIIQELITQISDLKGRTETQVIKKIDSPKARSGQKTESISITEKLDHYKKLNIHLKAAKYREQGYSKESKGKKAVVVTPAESPDLIPSRELQEKLKDKGLYLSHSSFFRNSYS